MLSEFVDAGSHLKDVAKEMMLQRLKAGSKARDLFYYLVSFDLPAVLLVTFLSSE
jgi:hypothetical protein